MAFELATIDAWLYQTLTGDATLQALLAVDNRPPNYQRGVYNIVAPETDSISRKQPQTPFIVFGPSGQDVSHTLCGARDRVTSTYRVTVWDTSSGAVSFATAQAIMARVDVLLDRQSVTTTTPPLFCVRETSEQTMNLDAGGRTDLAVSALYSITTTE
jgi:hypothetical protein